MKKVFVMFAVIGAMAFSAQNVIAQENAAEQAATEAVDSTETAAPAEEAQMPEETPMHQALKTKFIEGGAGFMALVIACLILGLALCIERILYLALSKTNTKKLLKKIEAALQSTLNIHAKVRLMAPGTLPRSEGKAKRVIDNRKF